MSKTVYIYCHLCIVSKTIEKKNGKKIQPLSKELHLVGGIKGDLFFYIF